MKIGFDAKRAYHNKTGLGNYSRSLIEMLLKFYPANEYYLFNPKPSDLFNPTAQDIKEILPRRGWEKKFYSFWRAFSLNKEAKRLRLDIYHGLSHELPFGLSSTKIKWFLTVHDLIFIRFPHYFNPLDRFIYRLKLSYSCKKADKIIAISQQTKRDLIAYLGIDEEKIEVVYQSCDEVFKQTLSVEQKEKVALKYNLAPGYLLQVGTIESRKNLLLSVRALQDVPAKVMLIVVGKPTPYLDEAKKEIERLSLQKRVTFLHSVPFEDLPALYQMAAVFLYPSRFEGFGIPIIEAINSNLPVIAATGSCLEEAGGPGNLYVSPDDPSQLAKYINSILDDPEKREEMVQAGKAYVERFSDQKIATDLMRLYEKAVK
jgi:glycosyltransferase involved in cell wall biosynthesis